MGACRCGSIERPAMKRLHTHPCFLRNMLSFSVSASRFGLGFTGSNAPEKCGRIHRPSPWLVWKTGPLYPDQAEALGEKPPAHVCTDAKRRESDAASRTRSLRRNCPGAAEIAGNPPAVASATPGVLRKNVSVLTSIRTSRRVARSSASQPVSGRSRDRRDHQFPLQRGFR